MVPFEEPMANKLYNTPFFGGADRTADNIGITLLGAAAIGIAAHAILTNIKKDNQ